MYLRNAVFALLLFPQLASAAESFGRVELSLNQWQETMDRLAKAESLNNTQSSSPAKAPCAAVISSVNCEITWQNEQLRLNTDFEIEVLSDTWTILPLSDARLPLISSQTSEGRILIREGAYALLTNKPGKIKVRLVQESINPENTDFWLSPATSTLTRLTSSDPNFHLTLNEKLLTSTPVALVANESGKTALQIRRTTTLVVEKVDLAPGTWESRSETQIAYEDGRLIYYNRVVLLCTTGDDTQATLHLPANCIILNVEGEGLEKWTSLAEKELTSLVLTWKKAGLRQRVFLVNLALTLPNIIGKWPLVSPQVPNHLSQSEIWQLTTPPGLQQAVSGARPLVASLSPWMRGKLADNDAPAFQAPVGSEIEITPLKTIVLAQARIEVARFSSELAVGGGMLTDARLEIATSEKTTVDLQFEKEARIISCRVAGQRQDPVDLGEGRIQLRIPVAERALVELTFSQQLPAFDPASGKVRLTMPLTSLLTKAASWGIKLPPGLSLSAFDGSVIADSTGSNGELRFHQELYRDTSPLVVLFYQKKIK